MHFVHTSSRDNFHLYPKGSQYSQNYHIDPDIFDLFIRNKVYLKYAKKFLDPKLNDQIDETKIPGYAEFGVMTSL